MIFYAGKASVFTFLFAFHKNFRFLAILKWFMNLYTRSRSSSMNITISKALEIHIYFYFEKN